MSERHSDAAVVGAGEVDIKSPAVQKVSSRDAAGDVVSLLTGPSTCVKSPVTVGAMGVCCGSGIADYAGLWLRMPGSVACRAVLFCGAFERLIPGSTTK